MHNTVFYNINLFGLFLFFVNLVVGGVGGGSGRYLATFCVVKYLHTRFSFFVCWGEWRGIEVTNKHSRVLTYLIKITKC